MDADYLDLFLDPKNESITRKPLRGNTIPGGVIEGDRLDRRVDHPQAIDSYLFTEKVIEVIDSKVVYRDLEHGGNTLNSTTDGCDLLARVMPGESITSITLDCNINDGNELADDRLETATSYSPAGNRNGINELTGDRLENGESITSITLKAAGGIEVDKNVQGWHPGAHEGSGACPPRAPNDGVRECDDEFLRLLDPDFKFDFEFRPGDHLPVWAVEVLASYPLLPDCWWDDEGFQLGAAGFGFHRKPDRRPPMAEDPTTREWEALAMRVIDGGIKISNSSEFRAIEIGIRALPRSRICAEAVRKIEASRPKKK